MSERARLDPKGAMAVRRPLQDAKTLPPTCYTSAEWYEREVQQIFFREWVCVGRVEQVPRVGDYFALDLVGEPLVIVRDEKGIVCAHVNVCRHRGAVIAQGEGNCKSFRCPYHSWTYALDGRLLGTPGRPRPMDDVRHFEVRDYGLIPVRAALWAGFIFVNFQPAGPELTTWLGDMPERLKNYRFEEMVCTRRVSFDVAANWKLPIENFLEPYHIDTVHAKHVDRTRQQAWSFEESRGPYEAIYGINSLSNISKFPVIEGLGKKEVEGLYHVWIKPNVKLSATPTYMKYFLFFPDGPDRHRLVCHWCFPRSTVRRDDFAGIAGSSYYGRGTIKRQNGDWVDEIILEDNTVVALCQRGLKSRFSRSGRYSTREALVHRVANYVLDRVLDGREAGRARRVSTPAPRARRRRR